MKRITVRRKQSDEAVCDKVMFSQEDMPGLVLTEWEVPHLVVALETIEPHSSVFFHENVGVRRQVSSVRIVRLTTRDEVLLELTDVKAKKLASSLRSSYPAYFQ